MTRRAAWFVLAAAGWTAYVWISRLYLMVGSDDSTGFKVVHGVIAVISLGFGIGLAWIGIAVLRSSRPLHETSGTDRDPEAVGAPR